MPPVTILAGRTVEFSRRLCAAGNSGCRYLQAREAVDATVERLRANANGNSELERAITTLVVNIGRADNAAAEIATDLVATRRAGARYV